MNTNKRLSELFKELVPFSGKADTVKGELVRAVNRIGYRFYNDGDLLGVGYGNETCNAAGRYIVRYGNHTMRGILEKMWNGAIHDSWNAMPEDEYEKLLEELEQATADYCDSGDPTLENEATDMFELTEDQDYEYDQEEEDDWDEEEDDWDEEEE
jgi:hypothetical protein